MLDSMFELITLSASNSLLVFCLCNLIIGILLVASSKSGSEVDDEDKNNSRSLTSVGRRDQENSFSFGINAESESPATTEEACLKKNVVAPAAELIETSTVSITVVDGCQKNRRDEDKHNDSRSLPSLGSRDEENSFSFDISAESESQTTTEVASLQKNVTAPAAELLETSTVSITVVDDSQQNSQDEDEDNDDDELRRRIEEFIEKINRGWKEEKLRTYAFVH